VNQVFLSRRNLEVLLSKLDRKVAGEETACTIVKYQNEADKPYMLTLKSLQITAVEDEEFYRNRSAGAMHPADEPAVERHATGTGVNIGL